MKQYAAAAFCAAFVAAVAHRADADPVRCADDHANGQRAEKHGALLDARARFLACAAPTCPSVLQFECADFLRRVEAALPSVALRILDGDGKDQRQAEIYVDGAKDAKRWTGRALPLDPGPHSLRIVTVTGTKTADVTLTEGDKNRAVEVRFERAADGPQPARPPRSTAVPTVSIVLGAIGILALGSFSYFAIDGKRRQNDMQATCAPPAAPRPTCSQSQADAMRRQFLFADVSLGVALVSLGGAGYFWIARDTSPRSSHVWSLGARGRF